MTAENLRVGQPTAAARNQQPETDRVAGDKLECLTPEH